MCGTNPITPCRRTSSIFSPASLHKTLPNSLSSNTQSAQPEQQHQQQKQQLQDQQQQQTLSQSSVCARLWSLLFPPQPASALTLISTPSSSSFSSVPNSSNSSNTSASSTASTAPATSDASMVAFQYTQRFRAKSGGSSSGAGITGSGASSGSQNGEPLMGFLAGKLPFTLRLTAALSVSQPLSVPRVSEAARQRGSESVSA
ncbi:hypothetical protein GQ42DRAFT_166036 [Ramicandelaber brevisporus]|nr:hypothetical protein GQ42DRAFT_166036 [Ramicandelaber brevisporus]